MEKVFYKYRGDSKFTEDIITSGKVFLATAHQLNDPFECSIKDICKDWMDEKIKEGMRASLSGFAFVASEAIRTGDSLFNVPPSSVRSALDSVLQAGDLEASYEAWRRFMLEQTGHPPSDLRVLFLKLDAQLVETGIFSLSCDPAQDLMWAHYADQHRGLCLGFRQASGSKLADPAHCLPVIYSNSLPAMETNGIQTVMSMAMDALGRPYTSSLKLAFTDKTFQRVVTTKPTNWAYEQEVRYIEPFGGLCDWPGPLAECTFGLRCRDDRRRYYIDLLETHVPNDVHLFEMRVKPGTNSIERVPLQPPATKTRAPAKATRDSSRAREDLSLKAFAARMEQLIQQERYGEVIFQVGENLKNYPSSPVLLHIKGTAHGLAQEHAIAYEIFRDLSEQHPNVAASWYGMACAVESMGRPDEAAPLLERAYGLDPNDPSIALNLGVHLVRSPETRAKGLDCLRQAEKLGHRRARRIIDRIEAEDPARQQT
jgi:tetratricopeptide (TPR) repeat protein